MAELNLIPYELRRKREKKLKVRRYVSMGIIISAILLVIVYIPNLYLNRIISKENSLKARIAINSKIFSENAEIMEKINKYEVYMKNVDIVKKQRVRVISKIEDLQKYIPLDLILTNIDYSAGVLTLNGNSSNYNSISVFVANLQMSEEYSSAKIVNITDEKGNIPTTVPPIKYKFIIYIAGEEVNEDLITER